MTCNCWRGLWSSPYHISEIFNNIFQPLFDILTSCKKYCDFFFSRIDYKYKQYYTHIYNTKVISCD